VDVSWKLDADVPDRRARRFLWTEECPVDESTRLGLHGSPCRLAAARGWGPKGERLRTHGHWRTLTFLGALRCDRFTAPCVIDGPINGESLRAYVEQQLVPCSSPATSSSWKISAVISPRPFAG
jgi:hypothetical protein